MLKINRTQQTFARLETPSLADSAITERYDLQEYIANSPDAFFQELGLELFLIGKEILPSKDVQDRIDLLAIDKEGSCVVIELKRGNHKLHLFQAISYSGMVSHWEPDDFLKLLNEDRQEELEDFLNVTPEEINHSQRIILVAEAYDYALLVGAEWLCEAHGIDIVCCRIAMATDSSSNAEYLVCSTVYPAPELAQEAVSRGRKQSSSSEVKWTDWKSALAGISNPAVTSYYEQELSANREGNLGKRILMFRLDGKRRWHIAARVKNAYVWQYNRFEGDIEFWRKGLSDPEVVKPIKRGQCLRVFLSTPADFEFFDNAAKSALQHIEWLDGPPDDEMDDPSGDE